MLQRSGVANLESPSGLSGGRITLFPVRMRLVVLVALISCACLAPVTAWGQTMLPAQAPLLPSSATVGQWAAPVNFCSYPCMVGADAAVLNTGKVLFYYY